MRLFSSLHSLRITAGKFFTCEEKSLTRVMSDLATNSNKRPNEEIEDVSNKRQCAESSDDRVKRKKVALLLGYCGHGYYGMQRNSGFKTIEEDLMGAMLKANLITEDSFKQMQVIQFQRAARTDKGVSAVRQVVSLKLPLECKSEDINNNLPEVIRVFAMKRVTKGFNSKSSCNARTYSYMLPTLAFSTGEEVESYRVTPDVLEKVRDALQVFTGTHNFHNFTSKKKAQDPSAIRYILNFECGEPFVSESGLEMITMKVKGQSFMLHQIRKMVGTVIAIVRGLTTTETIIKAWGDGRLDLPVAPGLGLVLEEVHYDRYNTKFGNDGMHERLTWDEVEEEIIEFKKKQIDPIIIQTELNEKSMYNWVQTLAYHSFGVRTEHVHEARARTANGTTIEGASDSTDNGSSQDSSQDTKELSSEPLLTSECSLLNENGAEERPPPDKAISAS